MCTKRSRMNPLRGVHVSPFLIALLLLPLAFTSASGGEVGTLVSFTNGTTADADEVNANFDALRTAVNDNDDRIVVLEGRASPTRIVLVSPVHGDTAASGDALRSAISGITDNGASNPYALLLEPGTYDIGTEALTLKPHVDLAGSGRDRTIITGTSSTSFVLPGALVKGAAHAEIRDLSIHVLLRYDSEDGVSLRNLRLTGRFVALEILSGGTLRLEGVHATSTVGMRARGDTAITARASIFEGVIDQGWPLGALIMDDATLDAKQCCFRSEPLETGPGSTGLYGVGRTTVRLAGCELEHGYLDASGTTFRMVNCYDSNFDPHANR